MRRREPAGTGAWNRTRSKPPLTTKVMPPAWMTSVSRVVHRGLTGCTY